MVQPKVRRALWLAAVVCLAMQGTSTGQGKVSQREKQLFDLVNHARAKAGLNNLEWDDHLAEAARVHSKLLAENQDLSHQFEGEPPLQQRAGATGAHFSAVAENVAAAPAVDVAHESLMKSPGHRANILNLSYNAVGIAIVERGGELYVTQDFAHTLASYTEAQFSEAVVSAFNQARRSKGSPAIEAMPDARLRKAACSEDAGAQNILGTMTGATDLAIFTASEPEALPEHVRKAAADKTLHRMNIGVCFHGGGKTGFSRFWVVVAFFP
jgi:uncharacterized protein YkwD